MPEGTEPISARPPWIPQLKILNSKLSTPPRSGCWLTNTPISDTIIKCWSITLVPGLMTKHKKNKSTAKKKRNRPRRKSKRVSQRDTSRRLFMPLLRKTLRYGWKAAVSLAVIFGVVTGLLFFSSRVSASSEDYVNMSKPFPSTFVVYNEGRFSVYDVKFSCGIRHIIDAESNSGIGNIRTRNYSQPIPEIRSGERTTTKAWVPVNFSNITSIDIDIEISYRPKFLFWRKTQRLRFVTEKEDDGQLLWRPRTL